MASAGLDASAQDFEPFDFSELGDVQTWDELCGIVDCNQFPVGYNTYVIGPSAYYFPTMSTMRVKPPNVLRGGVKAGGYYEADSNGKILRSLSGADNTTIPSCCHHLLTFYGLADAMPTFRESRDGNRMPSAFVGITPFDQPPVRSALRQHLGYGDKQLPNVRDLIGDDPLSYNAEFWLLSFHELDANGIRNFELLSKRPVLNGHFVYAGCYQTCSFRTLRLEKTIDEVRPHVFLGEMLLTDKNMLVCASGKFEEGCDPASEVFDQAVVMFGLIEEMLEAAAVFPAGDTKWHQ